jgi:hypothetical protein
VSVRAALDGAHNGAAIVTVCIASLPMVAGLGQRRRR